MVRQNEFLESILKYHQHLVDNAFVEKLMLRIEKSFRIRQWVLSVCSIIGMCFGLFGLSRLNIGQLELMEGYWNQFAPLVGTSIMVLVFLFFVWIFNEEFEKP